MKTDLIDEVGIDQKGRLYVRPRDCTFPFIYREGMEVNWDADNGHLYGPPPRTWDYIRWYRQIISAASRSGGCSKSSSRNRLVQRPRGTTK